MGINIGFWVRRNTLNWLEPVKISVCNRFENFLLVLWTVGVGLGNDFRHPIRKISRYFFFPFMTEGPIIANDEQKWKYFVFNGNVN